MKSLPDHLSAEPCPPRPPLADIVLPFDLLEADGDFNGAPAHTRLSHHVLLNGQNFHLEAIEVKPVDENGWMEALNPDLQDDVDQVFELNGDHSQTTRINHRDYLIYLIPFSQ